MSSHINRRDIEFVLYELLNIESLLANERFASYDRAAISAILDAVETLAAAKFAPIAGQLDAEEPTFDGQSVHTPPELKDALTAYSEAGYIAAGFDLEDGGMQLPWTVVQAVSSIFSAANGPAYAYAMLTAGNANLISAYGSREQKALYLPPMLEGRWFGTMCISEPQAGSSLSDIRTRAEPTLRGHYRITGSKMWISGGEHDLAENIVHLVLAKIPGGPPGVKGISLFIVPKYRVKPDGSLGELNNIALAGLNHKMGNRGTTNTLLNFGEGGECQGYLVGEVNKGLACMFHMMNEERVAVGLGAAAIGYAGYLYSLDYARNRPQGRHPSNKDPATPQVMIIEHADVRRLLLTQKVYVEGAYAFLLYCASLIDRQKVSLDAREREDLGLLLDLLTPIAKSWPSEFCLEASKHAIQVLGGYGYSRDYPLERLYRDNRVNPIHEGTHGVQGLDVLGRKVRMANGAALRILLESMRLTIEEVRKGSPALSTYALALQAATDELTQTTDALIASADLNRSLANATIYLDAIGHVVIAWTWLRQAIVASDRIATATAAEAPFYNGKLTACRFFFTYELPLAVTKLRILRQLDDSAVKMTDDELTGT